MRADPKRAMRCASPCPAATSHWRSRARGHCRPVPGSRFSRTGPIGRVFSPWRRPLSPETRRPCRPCEANCRASFPWRKRLRRSSASPPPRPLHCPLRLPRRSPPCSVPCLAQPSSPSLRTSRGHSRTAAACWSHGSLRLPPWRRPLPPRPRPGLRLCRCRATALPPPPGWHAATSLIRCLLRAPAAARRLPPPPCTRRPSRPRPRECPSCPVRPPWRMFRTHLPRPAGERLRSYPLRRRFARSGKV